MWGKQSPSFLSFLWRTRHNSSFFFCIYPRQKNKVTSKCIHETYRCLLPFTLAGRFSFLSYQQKARNNFSSRGTESQAAKLCHRPLINQSAASSLSFPRGWDRSLWRANRWQHPPLGSGFIVWFTLVKPSIGLYLFNLATSQLVPLFSLRESWHPSPSLCLNQFCSLRHPGSALSALLTSLLRHPIFRFLLWSSFKESDPSSPLRWSWGLCPTFVSITLITFWNTG